MPGLEKISNTRPYVSLILMKYSAATGVGSIAADMLEELKQALGLTVEDSNRSLLNEDAERTIGALRISWVHYLEEKPPAWLMRNSEAIHDRLNHLVVFCRKGKHLAAYCSDKAVKSILVRKLLRDDEDDSAFARVSPIPGKVLTDAFIGGPARTLWLSGIHRRTAVKADSKVLTGISLQDALNPLEDQSYHFTAARSVTELQAQFRPIGVAQRKSNVWLSSTNDWSEFAGTVDAILHKVSEAEDNPLARIAPLPFLAVPVSDASEVSKAFDVGLIPSELLSDDLGTDNTQHLQMAEKWAYRSVFEVVKTDGANVVTDAFLDEQRLGQLRFVVRLDSPLNISLEVEGDKDPGVPEELWRELLAVCNNPGWLTIRYESGQTLSDGSLYKMQLRDFPFDNWDFQDIGESATPPTTNPKKEKPTEAGNPHKFLVDEIGMQDSLFCWVRNNWFGLQKFASTTGWLACDDGAGEIADFIHLDMKPEDGGRPRVSLIHVKGSKSASAGRGVSVSDYEIVSGQAIKNLRFLDRINLADSLQQGSGKGVASATWENGVKRDDRSGMITALGKLGGDYRRRVIILQPRVTSTAHHAAMDDILNHRNTPRADRLRQLNTLLLGAEGDCHDLGADFFVIGSEV